MKALRHGFGRVRFTDIEVVAGAPTVTAPTSPRG